MKVSVDALRALAVRRALALGHEARDAALLADVCMFGELRRSEQGVAKLLGTGMAAQPGARACTVERVGELCISLDARGAPGAVALQRALDAGVALARERGVAFVGTRNSNTSSGCLGFYVRQVCLTPPHPPAAISVATTPLPLMAALHFAHAGVTELVHRLRCKAVLQWRVRRARR